MSPFHYAFKVKDIQTTREFYIKIVGCLEGRSTESWIDFNFFGNQLSAHVSSTISEPDYCGVVDGVRVPIPHFGCILSLEDFKALQNRFEVNKINFIVKPQVRYSGLKGEQLTMFVQDFSGNPLEFKYFKDETEIFE